MNFPGSDSGEDFYLAYLLRSAIREVIAVTTKRDYYEVLGVAKSADATAIKKAYRKLAKKYHPDTNAGNAKAEAMFKDVTEAYEILSNPEKKKMYDQFGHAAFDGSTADTGTYGRTAGGPQGGYREYHFESGAGDDIFGDIFGDIFRDARGRNSGNYSYHSFHGNDFGSGFNHGFSGQEFARKGSDLRSEVTVSFDEAVFGCDKIISLKSADKTTVQSLQVHIPAGIDDGKSVRLRGKGMPGSNGGEAGDLFLDVKVGKKPGYERKDMDVYTTVFVPFTTAVFGGEVFVETLYGRVLCKIEAGTQSGTKIRLRGKGIVSMKNSKVHGDQYVSVQIQVPKYLSPEEKQKLKEFEIASEKNKKRNTA